MANTLDHVGIAVHSLSEAMLFYERALEVEARSLGRVEAEGVAVASVGEGGSAWIELLESVDDGSSIGKFLKRHGPGIHHLAFRVDNLEKAIGRVEAEGGQVVGEPRVGVRGSRCVFVHPRSTGGVLIELVEHATIEG